MDNEKKDRMPRQLGKAAAESRGRENRANVKGEQDEIGRWDGGLVVEREMN